MWEQLKHKFMRLFENENSEQHKEETPSSKRITTNNHNKVETRISYQYPSQRSVKLPDIPDAPIRKDRNNYQESSYQRNNSQTSQRRDHYEKHKQVKKNHEEEPKQERKPFTPTDVPSPVYGFKNRPEKSNSLDIPAFLRKDFDKERSESMNKSEDKEMETIDENLNDQEPIQTHVEDAYNHSFELHNNELDEKTENEEDSRHKSLGDKGESLDALKSHSESRETKESRATKPTHPFNVLMTPRDKKNRFERKLKYQQKPASKQNNEMDQVDQSDSRNKTPSPSGPPLHLLNDRDGKPSGDREWVEDQIDLLQTTLKHFHVSAKVVNATQGPSVTRFEIQPEPGVKVSKIKNLSDDIKLNMAAKDIRMEAPIPGKNAIGIEVPNQTSQPVVLQEIFESEAFKSNQSPLSVALGLDISGNPIVTDLKKMPHGLIAGATGSGKSVCINTILVSLLYKASHEDVRFLLIDPKMVELAPYNDLPHLVSPVITDVKAATSALKWAVAEMEERYEKFVREGARDIERFNQKMIAQQRPEEKLPYLVIVIDELADLMMVSPQDVEDAICRIAQKARACGIHLLLATQRPSVDVITGLIKANIPTRIAFSVSSQVDSRTIIDTNGAEKLLGKGDMLFVENGAGQSLRVQGAFVSDDEIERITSYVKRIAPPNYLFEQEQLLKQISTDEDEDELYDEAVTFVVRHDGASASLLQRRFKIGYNRAARLIDSMEASGIISEQKGSKPRDILINNSDLDSMLQGNHSNS